MKKLKVNAILNVLADDDTMQWQIRKKDDTIRARQFGTGPCYCPITAYVKLKHDLFIEEGDAGEFCHDHLNADGDEMDMMMEASDNDYFGDLLEDPVDDFEFEHNFEVRLKEKIRKRIVKVTIGALAA